MPKWYLSNRKYTRPDWVFDWWHDGVMKRLLLAPLLVALAGCSSLSPHLDEAISHFESGNYKDAFKSCEKAIEEDSKSPDAYFCRGMAYLYLGKRGSAKKDFSKVIRLSPNDGAAYYWRGWIQYGKSAEK